MDTHNTQRTSDSEQEAFWDTLLPRYIYECYLKTVFCSVTSVLKWIRTFAQQYAQNEKISKGQCVVLELDEMWHYIGNKKNKLWIWKALDRNTRHLIDCECGDRDKATLEKLISRLSHLDIQKYYTDKWHVYESVLPACKLEQTKSETHHIERNNCMMRHWFGRFKRKSITVSKSKEMVDLTIALFARFRANGDVFDILNIVDNHKQIPLLS